MLIDPYRYTAPSQAALIPVNLALGTEIVAKGSVGEWDERIREIGNVLYDPSDSGEEYKLLYTGYQGAYGGDDVFVGYAYSANGISWTKGGKLTLGADRAAEDPYLIKFGSTYYLYVEDKEDVPFRNIRLYTSTDFSTWNDQGDVLDIGTGWQAQDVSSPTVWIEGATWYMLYEGRATNQAGAIGLATSTDGVTWTKSGSNPVIVGQNAGFGFAGPVSWSDGIAPDDIVKINGQYILHIHGRKDPGDVSYFRAGVVVSTDLISWSDAIGEPLYTVGAPDPTVTILRVGNKISFVYVHPGDGIVVAEQGAGDPHWTSVELYVSGHDYDAETRFYDLSTSWRRETNSGVVTDDTDPVVSPSSMVFGGTQSFTFADAAGFSFLAGDFTIEAMVEFSNVSVMQAFLSKYVAATNNREYYFRYNPTSGRLQFVFYSPTGGTADFIICEGAWSPSIGVKYHVAVARAGNTLRIFAGELGLTASVIGVLDVTGKTFFSGSAVFRVGAIESAQRFIGKMNALRVTKGARYTAAYTAPSVIYEVGPAP